MKSKLLFLSLALMMIVAASDFTQAQDEEEDLDPLRFYKAKYDTSFMAPIDAVREAVRKAIEDINCVVVQDVMKTNEDGWLKVIIKSDYCVFIEGDGTFDLLQKYSYEMPFIRGGSWRNGRMQYKFILTEKPDESVYVLLKGQMSGYEDSVTNRVHFWVSNGLYEHEMLMAIKRYLGEIVKE